MSSAVRAHGSSEQTDVPFVVRSAIKLGLLEAIVVLLFSLGSRFLSGVVELLVCGIILAFGVAAITVLPGLWTRARTIDGIASAAGIGLGAAFVFLFIDVALLQPIGTYTNRWLEIGGGSDWWYHPVWWMVGTFVPWMGAVTLANQAARKGASISGVLLTLLALVVVLGSGAVLAHLPHARWGLGAFGVAVIPAAALLCGISALGPRRS